MMSNVITTGFRLAKAASRWSTHEQHKIGAVIMNKRRLIGIGANLIKTHPIYANGDRWFSIHAEMKALISADAPVNGCDIYVYRVTANNELAMARPCDKCLEVLSEVGIKRVYYTTERGYNMEFLKDGKIKKRYL